MADKKQVSISIKAPNMQVAEFECVGNAPLVVHRFSHKAQNQMLEKMEKGSLSKKGKTHEAADLDQIYKNSAYFSKDGWMGFNASAVRNSLISACRLVGFKMTIAKLSVFAIQDGWDKDEPQIPLIRIYGKARRLDMRGNVETGQAYMTIRPCWDEWSCKVRIRYDADQFTVADIANLLSRVGAQVGWGEGRPDSKKSAGMGWGTFDVKGKKDVK